jgi:hypothetical protein
MGFRDLKSRETKVSQKCRKSSMIYKARVVHLNAYRAQRPCSRESLFKGSKKLRANGTASKTPQSWIVLALHVIGQESRGEVMWWAFILRFPQLLICFFLRGLTSRFSKPLLSIVTLRSQHSASLDGTKQVSDRVRSPFQEPTSKAILRWIWSPTTVSSSYPSWRYWKCVKLITLRFSKRAA